MLVCHIWRAVLFPAPLVGCAVLGIGYDSLSGVAGTLLPFWFFTLLVAKVSQW